jgi:hypothetical protein
MELAAEGPAGMTRRGKGFLPEREVRRGEGKWKGRERPRFERDLGEQKNRRDRGKGKKEERADLNFELDRGRRDEEGEAGGREREDRGIRKKEEGQILPPIG